MTPWYEDDPMSALEAKEAATRLAFAPIAFQAALALRDLGLLAALDRAGDAGLDLEQVAERSGVSSYGCGVLLDMGLSSRVVCQREGRFRLTRIGHFLLHDGMTRANMDFTADVCWRPMAHWRRCLARWRWRLPKYRHSSAA